MKLVIAIIRPERLEALRVALKEQDLYFMTVSEVLDFREDQVTTEIYRGRTVRRPQTKYKMEIAVEDGCADEGLETIERVCGQSPDSRMIVVGHEGSAQLYSCERGSAALSL